VGRYLPLFAMILGPIDLVGVSYLAGTAWRRSKERLMAHSLGSRRGLSLLGDVAAG
jgi:hypothetical protein